MADACRKPWRVSLTLLSRLCEGFPRRLPVSGRVESTVYARLLVVPKAVTHARFAAPALACLLAGVLALLCAGRAMAAEKHELLGLPVPDLVARGLNGENVRISEFRGQVVVVSFWNGSCNTCRAQLEA